MVYVPALSYKMVSVELTMPVLFFYNTQFIRFEYSFVGFQLLKRHFLAFNILVHEIRSSANKSKPVAKMKSHCRVLNYIFLIRHLSHLR